MRKLCLIMIIFSLISCRDSIVQGYFKRGESKRNFTFSTDGLIRVNGDTVIDYYRTTALKVDSIVYIWNEEKNIYQILNNRENIVGKYDLGNKKIQKITDNIILFELDTSKFSNNKEDEFSEDRSTVISLTKFLKLTLKDTFSKISKQEFNKSYEFLLKQDSLKLSQPFISEYMVKNTIEEYVDFYLDGKFIENSIEIRRQRDDLFHVKFDVLYNGYKDSSIKQVDYEVDTFGKSKASITNL